MSFQHVSRPARRVMSEAEREVKLKWIARLTEEELRGWIWARRFDGWQPFEGEVAALARQARELLDEIDACRMAVSVARQGGAKTRAEPQAWPIVAVWESAIGTVRTVAFACIGPAIGASVVTLLTVIAWAGK